MDSLLKCSVVIPTYNRVRLLRYTLDSLTRQSLPRAQFEVLICDDGSSDSTAAMVEDFRDRLDLRYFWQPDEGFRAAKARNLGIADARANICVLIDDGVLLHSGCLAAHVASHELADGPVAVCGYAYCFNVDNEAAVLMNEYINFEDPDATIGELSEQRRWLDIREEFYARYCDDFDWLPAPWMVYWACNASARTEQLRAVGMFDETFRSWGGEDVELGYRLHRDGAKLIVNRQASAIHSPHPKSLPDNLESVTRNFRYMGDKHRTPITRLLADEPTISPFVINDVIQERGIMRCADYLSTTGSPPSGVWTA